MLARLKPIHKYTLIIIAGLTLQGCATNATIDGMVPASHDTKNKELYNNIHINENTGGHETNPLWTSKINNSNFHGALIQSLKNAKLYNESIKSRYVLDTNIVDLNQDFFGLELTYRLKVGYNIINRSANKSVYHKIINTKYTATTSDSIIGVRRLRLANEGAARKNIGEFIASLNNLKILSTEIKD